MENATDKWICSYHPLKWYVGGREMQTLTFGHMTLMERVGCFPFITAEHIVHCIMICEREYKDSEDYVYHLRKYEEDIVDLTKDVLENMEDWMASLSRYFSAHTNGMITYVEENNNDKRNGFQKKAGSPWLSCMRVRLLSRLNYNPETIDEAPFGRCLLDIQTLLELDGHTRIVGDDEARAMEILDRAIEKANG